MRYLYQDRCTETVLVVYMVSFPFSHFLVIFKVTLKENSSRVIVQVCKRVILRESEKLVWPQLTLTETQSYHFRRRDSG